MQIYGRRMSWRIYKEEYVMIGEFLANLKELEGRDNEIIKVVELKKVKQESRTMEEFI